MVALNDLFDKRRLALARARLSAWWEGEIFDEDAAMAEIEARFAAANDIADDEALFEPLAYTPPPRLIALATLWGRQRIRPAGADAFHPAQIALAGDGVLAALGPGGFAPLAALAAAHPGAIEAFEWREETFAALEHGIAKAKLGDRLNAARIDLDAHVFPADRYDGLISTDDFAYCSHPPHLAQQIAKCLKPGACAVVESYVGPRGEDFATAFASSFAEPCIQAHGDLVQIFRDAGLAVDADEDITERFLDGARQCFKALGDQLTGESTLDVAAVRELAFEAEAWRPRLRLMSQRRLERRRFALCRNRE